MPQGLPERYEVLEDRPRGRFGPRLLALDRHTDRRVLVRTCDPGDALATRRFRAAMARATRVAHPGLVEVVEAEGGTDPRLVTAWVDHTAAERRGLGWERVRGWMTTVLRTLGDLHARGLWHGDVRAPALFEDGDRCWLSEPWAPQVPPVVDQWAAGALLWELVTGGRPGIGTTPQFPVPEDLGRVLGVLVHPDPLGRFAHCADAARALERLDGRPGTDLLLLPDPEVFADPVVRRPTAPALPRSAPRSRAAPVVRPPEALWEQLVAVDDRAAPRVVVLLGDPAELRSAVDALEEAAVADGLADVVRLSWGEAADDEDGAEGALVADLPPSVEARGSWLGRVRAADGAPPDRAAAEGSTLAEWMDGRRADRGDLALEELIRRLRASAWRGRAVLCLERVDRSRAPEEGWGLASAFLAGTLSVPVPVPALIVAGVSTTALGRPEVVNRLDALTAAGAVRVAVTAAAADDVTRVEEDVASAPTPAPSKRERDALHLAALAGEEVPIAPIARWAGESWETLQTEGSWTVRGGRLRWGPVERRRRVAEAAARPDARYLHRRLAVALRGAGRPLEAARHAVRSGDAELTASLCCAAAARAHATGRPDRLREAVRLAAELASGPAVPEAWAAELDLWAGADADARDDDGAAALLARARTRGEPVVAVRAAILAARRAERSAADAWLGEAVTAARSSADLELEQGAMLARAGAYLDRDALGEADHWYGKALARATQRADLPGAARALLGQASLAVRAGRFSEAWELLDEASDAVRAGHDPLSELRLRITRAVVHRQLARSEAALEAIPACHARAIELGASGSARALGVLRGQALADLRRTDEAEAAFTEAEAAAAAAGDGEVQASAAVAHALLHLARGELDAAYDAERRAAARLETLPGHPLWGRYRLAVAVLLALRGDHTRTWQWLWSAQEQRAALGADLDVAWCLERLVAVAMERGWANVLRLSGQLGVEQLDRLGQEQRASALRDGVTAARG